MTTRTDMKAIEKKQNDNLSFLDGQIAEAREAQRDARMHLVTLKKFRRRHERLSGIDALDIIDQKRSYSVLTTGNLKAKLEAFLKE